MVNIGMPHFSAASASGAVVSTRWRSLSRSARRSGDCLAMNPAIGAPKSARRGTGRCGLARPPAFFADVALAGASFGALAPATFLAGALGAAVFFALGRGGLAGVFSGLRAGFLAVAVLFELMPRAPGTGSRSP
ncbi:MAG: hypothetical protein WKG00_23760 [Polyangiaceae bacterium]